MAEAKDLKSFKCGFESHCADQTTNVVMYLNKFKGVIVMAIDYNPQRELGFVIATIRDTQDDAIKAAKKLLNADLLSPKVFEVGKMKAHYSVKVKCHPGDEFDEAEGKKMAKKRLLDKYYDIKDRAVERILNKADQVYRD